MMRMDSNFGVKAPVLNTSELSQLKPSPVLFCSEAKSAKSLKEQIDAQKEAFLKKTVFSFQNTDYKTSDILQAVKEAVSQRQKNPFLWMAFPLWIFGEHLHPRYVTLDRIAAKVPHFTQSREHEETFLKKLSSGLSEIAQSGLLKSGTVGDWLGMTSYTPAYSVEPNPKKWTIRI
jgi:hypothetical protein